LSEILQSNDFDNVTAKLHQISKLISQDQSKFMVVAQEELIPSALESTQKIVQKFPALTSPAQTSFLSNLETNSPSPSKIFVPVPFPVHYCAMALPTIPYRETEEGVALQLAATLATHKVLHREVREKGGAYGAGATMSPSDGVFAMHSYRDPRSLETHLRFNEALQWLMNPSNISTQALNEAKLSQLSSLDAPVDVGAQGSAEFMYGVTKELRQARRDALFRINQGYIAEVAKKWLLQEHASRVVLGPEQHQEQFEKDGWEVLNLNM
jgi:Zn-dependent M16 (insulinase) family peptidase